MTLQLVPKIFLISLFLFCPAYAEQMGQKKISALQSEKLPKISPAPQELVKSGTARVIGIIDPLRLQLDDRRIIRLSGIEIPDLSLQDPGPLSLKARDVLKELFLHEKINLYISPDKKNGHTSKMGHLQGHIIRQKNEIWAQGTLLSLGLARVQVSLATRQLVKEMLEIEQNARSGERGLWSQETYQVLKPSEISPHQQKFQIIQGKILNTATLQNQIILNFGKDRRRSFRAVISPEARRLFIQEDLFPLEWQGQEVRMRGIPDKGEPLRLELDHPGQIELLKPSKTAAKKELDDALPRP